MCENTIIQINENKSSANNRHDLSSIADFECKNPE